VMRRSTNGGMRIVPKERLLELIPEDARRVGLVGAAVSDHPKIVEVVRTLAERGCEVGLSSLRPDRLTDEFVGALRLAGYKTLTTAMDGTSERVRETLERRARPRHLQRAAELARQHGMNRLKLYLMVGVPGETDADVDECVAFVSELSRIVPVALGIAPFCPKRNTPLHGARFAGIDVVNKRLDRLRRGLRGRADVRATSARWAWVEAVLAAGANTDKPLLFVQGAGNHGDAARVALRKAGYGYLDSPHDALKVTTALALRQPPAAKAADTGIAFPTGLPAGFMTEPAARRLIESGGIPSTRWQLAADADEAVRAVREIGGAVAVKAVSAAIVHKSDVGAVRLNVEGEDAVRKACAAIAQAAQAAGVKQLDGFLVTEMFKADAELILGVQHDPNFGPMVMVGAGGVLVELMKDVRLAPAPLSHATALDMIESLKSVSLLRGYRGKPPANLDRIADALVRLGALAAASKGRLLELDINPLFVAGDRIVAADARATLA